MKVDVVVTRHPGLLGYLRNRNLVAPGVRVISHATEDDVRDKVVLGPLPLHLAALAKAVYNVDLNVPPDKRGAELSEEEVERYAKGLRLYKVEVLQEG